MVTKGIRVGKKAVAASPKKGVMTAEEFDRRVRFTRMNLAGKTVQAVRLVLVEGMSRTKAAQALDLNLPSVSRGVKKLKDTQLEHVKCPTCGTMVDI